MERRHLTLKDNELNSIFLHIFDNAFGNPIVLGSAPASAEDMKANTWGVDGSDIYIRFGNGSLIKFTGTPI